MQCILGAENLTVLLQLVKWPVVEVILSGLVAQSTFLVSKWVRSQCRDCFILVILLSLLEKLIPDAGGAERQTGELCSKILWFETEEHQEWSCQQTSESWHWKLNTGLNLVSHFSPSMCWHRLSAVQRACCLCFPLELQSSWSAWLLWLSSSQDTALGMSGAQLPAEPVFSALSADSTLGWRSTAG